jgi:DNA primase
MRLSQIAIPAVGLLGAHLSAPQRQLLPDTTRIVIMLDGDSTGRTASTQIKRVLADSNDVHVVNLPDTLDPDDLTDRQLRSLLLPFFPL